MKNLNNTHRPLTVKEFAKAVGLDYKTVWRACTTGQIENYRINRTILIPRRVADRYLGGEK